MLDRLRDGRPQSHGFNAKILIGEDPLLKGNISYNLFSENAEAHPGLPWFGLTPPGAGDAQPWNDADLSALCNYLAEFYRFKGKDAVCDALDEVSRRRQRHPVRQWLASLRWDGVPRLETAIIRLLGARDDAATREITKLWFCGAVARGMQPGCKVAYMPILKGPQGGSTSPFFGTLFHPWFPDPLDIPAQVGKVGGEDGRCDLDGHDKNPPAKIFLFFIVAKRRNKSNAKKCKRHLTFHSRSAILADVKRD